jgi:SAM-dependent methyltransferase
VGDERISRRGLFNLGRRSLRPPDPPAPPPRAKRRPPAPPPEPLSREERAGLPRAERIVAARDSALGQALWAPVAEVLVRETGIGPGSDVLDAGAGEGVVASAAVAAGAKVTAVEEAAALAGRGREALAGVDVTWSVQPLHDLPWADDLFDVTLSAFALASAVSPAGALAEMFRVLRPGGTLALLAWRPTSAPGALLRLAAEHDPPPFDDTASHSWGREDFVRDWLAPYAAEQDAQFGDLRLVYGSPAQALDAFEGVLDPLAAAIDVHPEEVRAAALDLLEARAAPAEGGGIVLDGGWLLSHARKSGAAS